MTRILNRFSIKFDQFFDRNLIKLGTPKIYRNLKGFCQILNTNHKPATCSKYRACQQKQGFCPLRIRSTIAIKSGIILVKKNAVLVEILAILISRTSSRSGESNFERISTNFCQFLIEFWSNLYRSLHNFEPNWDRNSIPSEDRNFDRILIGFRVLEQRPGTSASQASCPNLDLSLSRSKFG